MKYEANECIGCAVPGYPCRGNACSYRHYIWYRCNHCKADELYEEEMYDEDFCIDCAKELGLIDDEEEED